MSLPSDKSFYFILFFCFSGGENCSSGEGGWVDGGIVLDESIC